MANSIILKGDPLRKELVAAAAITPGELLERDGSGGVQAASGAAGAGAPIIFAAENDLVGDGIDDDYAANDTVQCLYPRSGDEIYAWLSYGESVQDGAALESDGAGALQALTSGRVVAFAIEDVANVTTDAPARIKVEVA